MMQNNMIRTYDGAVAIITGGASGIGRALGEALAQRGADVVLADRQADLAEGVAGAIRAKGRRASAAELDVTDFAATERLVRQTMEQNGRLDYMFNNAGIGIGGEVRYYDLKDWEQVIDVNIRGVIHGIQVAYPVMPDRASDTLSTQHQWRVLFRFPPRSAIVLRSMRSWVCPRPFG